MGKRDTQRSEGDVELRDEIDALRERAQRAELRADGFVHMVHEIRTLLGAMTGLSTMLLDGELLEEQRENVKRIRASGAALLEVVNGVLDFSKLEAGALQVDCLDFDLRRKLEEVVALAADRAVAQGIELGACIDPGLPTAVAGDGIRLRQALLNLVINAVKFTREGSVVVRARPADVDSTDPDRIAVTFDVLDTGCGIAKDAVAQVFEPFRQAEGHPEERSQGTGLGLAIVRGFAQAMGGSVECESELGRGTRFSITLQLLRRAHQKPSPARVDVSGKRLLLVEPLDLVRRDLHALLLELGLEVTAVASLEHAHRVIRYEERRGRALDLVVVGVTARDARFAEEIVALTGEVPGAKLILSAPIGVAVPPSIAGLVTKSLSRPLRASRLVAAIEGCFTSMQETVRGLPIAHEAKSPSSGRERRSAETAEHARLTALIVEDEPVNARIARYMVEKRGWAAEIAVDGQEAVDRLRSERYDLVLLDWHTPRLDGLAAAREIRSREAPGQRTPLVALTAIATEGAREQCLDAGMDDFLTKPIVAAELDTVLGRVVAGAYRRSTSTHARSAVSSSGIDFGFLSSVAGVVGGDRSMVTELGRIFAESAPARLRELTHAVAVEDGPAAYLAAHSLRGMTGQIGAAALSRRCSELEQLAKTGNLSAIAPMLGAVEVDLSRVLAGFEEWLCEGASDAIRAAG